METPAPPARPAIVTALRVVAWVLVVLGFLRGLMGLPPSEAVPLEFVVFGMWVVIGTAAACVLAGLAQIVEELHRIRRAE